MTSRRLNVGDKVPHFWTRDMSGKEVDSKKLEGYTILAFLRYAGCPFCNLAIYRLSHEYKKLKKHGCDVVAFVQSTEDSIEKNILLRHDMTPPFTIIPDHDQDFYRMFGVHSNAVKAVAYTIRHAPQWMDSVFKKGFKQADFDGNSAMVPAYFLVKGDEIILADYSASFYDDSTFERIYKTLK